LSDWEKARTSLTRAIELDRTLPEPHNNLAMVLMKLGDEKGALSELLKTAKAPVAFNNMGVLYLKEKNFEQAQAFFKEAVSLDPQYEIANRNLSAVQAAIPPAAIIHLPSFGVHNSGNGIVTATCPEPEKSNSPTIKPEVSSAVEVERDLAGSTTIVEPDPLPLEETTAPKAEVVKPLSSEANQLAVEKPNQESTDKKTEQTSDVAFSLPSQTKAPEPENRPAPKQASTAPEPQLTACMYSSEFALHTPSNVNLENPRLIMGGGIVLLLAASATAIRVRGSRRKVRG
jgi:tetratricopeptide (TPR) repeat protein